MKKTIRNLLLLSCLFFCLAFDSCTFGVDYDKRNKINPEYDGFSCTFGKVYGKRWERLGQICFGLGASLTISALLMWHRREQSENKSILFYIQQE